MALTNLSLMKLDSCNNGSVKIFTYNFLNSMSVPSLTMVMINGPRGHTNGPMDPNAYKRVG